MLRATEPPVITIDGPAASGKGTLGKLLAQKLGFSYLDSGLLFRSLAFLVLEKEISIKNLVGINNIAKKMKVSVPKENSSCLLLVNGRFFGNELRDPKVSEIASKIAICGPIRDTLTILQRSMRAFPGLVCDGRDLGSFVFKDAILKIFLEASFDSRVERRYKELLLTSQVVEKSDIIIELGNRDERDRRRKISPLIPSSDSFVVDSSNKSPEEVFNVVWDLYMQFGIKRLERVLRG